MATYPKSEPDAKMGPDAWQQVGRGMGPDAVLEGLGVTVVSGLTVRIGTGRARVGGFIWENPTNLDITTAVNLNAGQNRTDSLFLRLQYDPNTKATSIVPVILSAVGGIPTPVQGGFPGVPNRGWEMRLARWSVVGPTAQIQFLTTDGPGDAIGRWARDAYPLISTSDLGVPDLFDYYQPQYSRGPRPASVSGMNFTILHPGIYTAKFDVHLGEARAAVAAADASPSTVPRPYIRLRLPEGDSISGFLLGLMTLPQHGRASISAQFAYNSTTPFDIEPRIFQASGSTQNVDFRFSLARLGS